MEGDKKGRGGLVDENIPSRSLTMKETGRKKGRS